MTPVTITLIQDEEGNVQVVANSQVDLITVYQLLIDSTELVSIELKPILSPGPSPSLH